MPMYVRLLLGRAGRTLRSRKDLLMEKLVLRRQLAVHASRQTKPQFHNEAVTLYDDDPELADLHQSWLAAETRVLEARNAERRLPSQADEDGLLPPEIMMELANRAQEVLDATDEWNRLEAEYTAALGRYHDTRRIRD